MWISRSTSRRAVRSSRCSARSPCTSPIVPTGRSGTTAASSSGSQKVGRFEDASQRKASAMMLSASVRTAIVVVAAASTLPAQDILKQTKIPPGAKVFVQSMDGFETYLLAAFTKKKTPIVVVDDLDQAD